MKILQIFYGDETAIQKSGKAAKWSSLAVLLLAIVTTITGNPALFAWHSGVLVIAANVLLVFLKNLQDPTVKNF